MPSRVRLARYFLSFSIYLGLAQTAVAATVPGPADASRVNPAWQRPVLQRASEAPAPILPPQQAPRNVKNASFFMKNLRIQGVTAFSPEVFAQLYQPYVGRTITLDMVWKITNAITEHYRNAGYFLSHAYLPEQQVGKGTVVVQVVEGYVGTVELEPDIANHPAMAPLIRQLVRSRPLTSRNLESFLLKINDLPGLSFRAILSQSHDKAEDGALTLTLAPAPKSRKGSVTFDNFGSRFLGPNEASATYQASLLPMQQTTLSGVSSMPMSELRYGTIDHVIAVAPNTTLGVNAGITKSSPGYNIKKFEFKTLSASSDVTLNYQWIRQREKNLATRLAFGGRNTDTDVLNVPFTRDRIRTARLEVTYDTLDAWKGYNVLRSSVTQGIPGLGASRETDRNLSRAGAKPDFTKFELFLTHLQPLGEDWSLVASTNGQLASGTLFSAEEFGYGGQAFGRAFDGSEIIGDEGIAGALELRYQYWSELAPIGLTPYTFVDAGKAWNKAAGQPSDSGASTGLGVRFTAPMDASGNLGLAVPIGRDADTPIYGANSTGPRVILQLMKEF